MKSNSEIGVLIAEDEYLVCKDIKRTLKHAGFQVLGIAKDGQEAVEMTHSLQPDLVFMDIMMPKMDGLEATRIIQAECPTPVFILTAYDAKELVDKAVTAGVICYLSKPLKIGELERMVPIGLARFEDLKTQQRLNQTLTAANRELEQALERYQATEQSLQEEIQRVGAELNEKETLLKDIHHRVKNHFQIISSLLKLQSTHTDQQQVAEALRESQNRVYAMALMHEIIYQNNSFSRIDLKHYLSRVANAVFRSYRLDTDRIQLIEQYESISVEMQTAFSLSLILTELLSNAFKYAFPDDHAGEIRIRLSKTVDDRIELAVEDNGIGFSGDPDTLQASTAGLKLAKNLVEQQLKGQMEVLDQNGARFRVTCPSSK